MNAVLRNLFPFWSIARGAYSAVGVQVAPAMTPPAASEPAPAPVAAQPDPRIAALAAQLVDEHNREVRIAGTVLKLRRIIRMNPDQAHRNCLALQDRNTELRAEIQRLELEVARLQGRKTEQDWTGGFLGRAS